MPDLLQILDGAAEAAARRLGSRTVVGSILKSQDWEDLVPTALRDRAYFSAGVEHTRWLARSQEDLLMALRNEREQLANGKTANMDRSAWIGAQRARVLGLRAAGEMESPELTKLGTLQDLASRTRLKLIYDTQWQSALGNQQWANGQDEDVLRAFPAQELFRAQQRDVPRPWATRWGQAGGRIYGVRMIARKDSPIWARINRFGVPWPPFDFNSGMDVRDIGRAEAIRLGVISATDQVQPIEHQFNDHLQADLAATPPELLQQLKSFFGDQLDISGSTARWRAAA